MSTYVKADHLDGDLRRVMKKYHPDLLDAGVTVGILLAHAARDESGEPKGPALKHHGYAAAAIIRIVSLKDRVAGLPDAVLYLDGDAETGWDSWTEARREAVLDHECEHLKLRKDDEGGIILDDCNRPKLKMRPHDFQIGGFYDIAQRHGLAEPQVEAVQLVYQKLLPCMEEHDAEVVR